MNPWIEALREGLVGGSVASVTSTVALAVGGRLENQRAAAPLNAVSHWAWPREALHEDRITLRHTLLGYAIHHGASVMWATLYARTRQARRRRPSPTGAAATAAMAALVDLKMTPERLTPGFERRLSNAALLAVYASFALGLLAGARLAQRIR